MVRWRYCLVLALLLLLPTCGGSKSEEDDDDERHSEEGDEDDDDEDDEDDDESTVDRTTPRRRAPDVMRQAAPSTKLTTTKPRLLECFVCAYKAETPLRACLDPTKFRVHTIVCHSSEDRCFTSVVARGNTYEAVVRGCRTSCVPTPDTTCCELNRCNSQAFAMPVQLVEAMPSLPSKTSKSIPPTVLFFVTILLLLQTVVKVSFV